jgi:hypothetical protein
MPALLTFAPQAVNIAFTAIWVPEVRYGVGKHVKTLNPADASSAVRLQLVQVCLSLWIMIFVKISLSLLLIRIGIGKIWKWILAVCIGVFVVITVINMAFVIGRCTPVQSLWDPTVNGTCILTPAQLSYNNNAQIGMGLFPLHLPSLTDPFRSICNPHRYSSHSGASNDDLEAPHGNGHKVSLNRPLRFRTSVRRYQSPFRFLLTAPI